MDEPNGREHTRRRGKGGRAPQEGGPHARAQRLAPMAARHKTDQTSAACRASQHTMDANPITRGSSHSDPPELALRTQGNRQDWAATGTMPLPQCQGIDWGRRWGRVAARKRPTRSGKRMAHPNMRFSTHAPMDSAGRSSHGRVPDTLPPSTLERLRPRALLREQAAARHRDTEHHQKATHLRPHVVLSPAHGRLARVGQSREQVPPEAPANGELQHKAVRPAACAEASPGHCLGHATPDVLVIAARLS